MTAYFTVGGCFENITVIERSKFICSIKGVNDELEAKEFIEQIRKKHSLATHNCYAYIADDKGLVQKFSDDGEPQGTAGMPMLDVLKNKRMFKTVAVVTRYFGGVKLGTGGLVRAYSGSVCDALNVSQILDMQESSFYKIETDYEGYSLLLKLLSNDNVSLTDTEFLNSVSVKIAVKAEFSDKFVAKLIDSFNGKIKIDKYGSGYFAYR